MRKLIIPCIASSLAVFLLSGDAQQKSLSSVTPNDTILSVDSILWYKVAEGLYVANANAPIKSPVNNSVITILKIDPKYYSFRMMCASEHGKKRRSLQEWCEEFGLIGAFNAGMFNTRNMSSSMGYMKNYGHINNYRMNPKYKAMVAFNRRDMSVPEFQISDEDCQPWSELKYKYSSCFQGMRMIDCKQQPIGWNAKPRLKCSMVVLAQDMSGNALVLFTRSPYSPNDFIRMMQIMPLKIKNAIYLEGGPEAGVYLDYKDFLLVRMGSWVSDVHEEDTYNRLYPLPNVVGFVPVPQKEPIKKNLHKK